MGKDKSILEKITGTMKDIANIAAEAADHAMKSSKAPPKAVERSAVYIPLAADGLVSDPMMVPPIATVHAPRRKHAASRRAGKASRKTPAKKTVKIRREANEESYSAAVTKRSPGIREENQQENAQESAQGQSLNDLRV